MHTTEHGKRSQQPGGRRGLSGKARRNRSRGRAARLYTQQMIDEYLEDKPGESRPKRFIPIRGRSEFLPSAKCPGSEVRDEPKRRSAIRLGSGLSHPTNAPVVRPPRQPQTPEQKVLETFTTRGFLYGCAMGSAAAAVVLLLVQVVLP